MVSDTSTSMNFDYPMPYSKQTLDDWLFADLEEIIDCEFKDNKKKECNNE